NIGVIKALEHRDEDALTWARRAVVWADERAKRSVEGPAALARDRPKGLPLDMLSHSAEYLRVRIHESRRFLLERLIVLGRWEEGRKLGAEVRSLDDNEYRWRPSLAQLELARGRADDGRKLLREAWEERKARADPVDVDAKVLFVGSRMREVADFLKTIAK